MPTGASRLGFWSLVEPLPVDYIVVQYVFTDGRDLDSRTKMTIPNVGGDYVGWDRAHTQGGSIVTWGGDNTGTGVESVLINLIAYKTAYPAVDTFRMEFNCFWYGDRGYQPVFLVMTMYTGGKMVKTGFTWTNPTATSTQQLTSPGKYIILNTQNPASNGEPLGYCIFDVETGAATLNIYP